MQAIDWAHDDAHVGLARRMACAADAAGGRVVLATSRDVLLLEPVPLERQVRDALKRKRFAQALRLIDDALAAAAAAEATAQGLSDGGDATGTAAVAAAATASAAVAAHEGLLTSPRTSQAGAVGTAPPPPWVEAALAQAGLLLLLDCDFDAAFACLARCPPPAFQPAQLLDLFPEHGQRLVATAGDGVPRRAYWGLHGHGPLPPLPRLVGDWLELQAATWPGGQRGRAGAGGAAGASLGAADAAAAGAMERDLVAAGTAAAAAYLSRARLAPGVALRGAVDGLLVRLLAAAGDAAALEALAADGCGAADADDAAAALEGAGRWHALALLRAAQGRCEEALRTWRALSCGELAESAAKNGAVAAAAAAAATARAYATAPDERRAAAAKAVAVDAAAREMADAARVPAAAALAALPWLLGASPRGAEAVLAARADLPPAAVLALLDDAHSSGSGSGGDDGGVRRRYLRHAVHARGTSDAALHTDLGLALVAAARGALADLEAAVAAAAAAGGDGAGEQQQQQQQQHGGGGQALLEALLRAIGERLPIVYAPNGATPVSGSGSSTAQGPADAASTSGAHRRRALVEVSRTAWGRSASRGEHRGAAAASASLSSRDGAAHAQVALFDGHYHWAHQRPSRSHHGQHHHHHHHQHQHCPVLAGAVIGHRAPPASGLSSTRRTASLGTPAAASGLPLEPASGTDGPPVGLRELPLPRAAGAGLADDGSSSSSSSTSGSSSEDDAGDLGGAPRPLPRGLRALLRVAPPAVAAAARRLRRVRAALAYHLQASLLYDARAVLAALRGARLWHEAALALSRAGAHRAALRVLALRARAVDGAIAYTRALGGGGDSGDSGGQGDTVSLDWLLDLFLRPAAVEGGSGSGGGGGGDDADSLEGWADAESDGPPPAPDFAAAVRVLNAHGARLCPTRLLQALGDDAPLSLVGDALARMLGGVAHRRREARVERALRRARHVALAAERAELLAAGRVVIGDSSACRGCGRLLGGRVVFRLPSGVVLCGRCVGPTPPEATGAVAAAAEEQQQQQQQQQQPPAAAW